MVAAINTGHSIHRMVNYNENKIHNATLLITSKHTLINKLKLIAPYGTYAQSNYAC